MTHHTQARLTGRHKTINGRLPKAGTLPLTRNQKMIYRALCRMERAVKAYELLDRLRPQGVKAAPTVYRALHELEAKGLVRHLVSSRSFVALGEPACEQKRNIMFVCEDCGKANTIDNNAIVSALESNAREMGFKIRTYHLELSTSCLNCAPDPEHAS